MSILTSSSQSGYTVQEDDPWPSHSFDTAMRTAQITGLVAAQPVFLSVALLSELRVGWWWAVVLHAAVTLFGAVALVRRSIPATWFMLAFLASMILGSAMATEITEPLAILSFTAFIPAITIPIILSRNTFGALLSMLAVAALASASFLWFHPDWSRTIALTSFAALVAVCLGVAILMRILHRLTEEADRVSAEAAEEQEHAAQARASVRSATEGMRLLHDTIVNTLGSISSAHTAMLDANAVRNRCRGDLSRIEHYLAGNGDPLAAAFEWSGLGLLPVVETGMNRTEFLRYVALLPVEAAEALHGCSLEALRNATKHSGAASVVFDTRIESNAVVVTIADDGHGFDGAAPAGRGLAESFHRRAENAGLQATVETAPGRGTRARIVCPLDVSPDFEATSVDFPTDETIAAMQRRVSWIPAAPALGATLVEITVQPTGFPQVHLAFLITAALALTVWLASRGGRGIPSALTALIVIAYPASLLLALAGTELPGSAYAFPSVMFTILPVLLHATTRSWSAYLLTLLLALVAVVAHCFSAALAAQEVAILVGPLLIPVMCVLAIWHIFDAQVRRIGTVLANDRKRALEARIETAARYAAASSRARLSSAGLAESLGLLRGIAQGDADPADDGIRARCGVEERYLRQLLALPTDAPFVSWWLATSLARARSRGVRMQLQADDARVTDAADADAFGRVVLAAVECAEPGTGLTVSIIRNRKSPRLFIVGERTGIGADRLAALAEPCEATIQSFASQTIVEVEARESFWDRLGTGPVAVPER